MPKKGWGLDSHFCRGEKNTKCIAKTASRNVCWAIVGASGPRPEDQEGHPASVCKRGHQGQREIACRVLSRLFQRAPHLYTPSQAASFESARHQGGGAAKKDCGKSNAEADTLSCDLMQLHSVVREMTAKHHSEHWHPTFGRLHHLPLSFIVISQRAIRCVRVRIDMGKRGEKNLLYHRGEKRRARQWARRERWSDDKIDERVSSRHPTASSHDPRELRVWAGSEAFI